MQKSNVDILNHFYGLLIELNFHRPDEAILEEKNYSADPFIQKHLQQIRLRTARYRALRQKNTYDALLKEIQRLKDFGFDKLRQLLNPQEVIQLQPLFHKFEELSDKDKESIAEDQELLYLLSTLKNKIDKQNTDE